MKVIQKTGAEFQEEARYMYMACYVNSYWLVMSFIGLLHVCHLSLELCNYACLHYCYIDGSEEGGCKKKAKTKATPPRKHLAC